MLIFPLKKEWFEKIRSGEKTVEYREVKPYWTKRLKKNISEGVLDEFFDCTELGSWIHIGLSPEPCVLRLGYTKRQMTAEITKIEVVDGKDTDLRVDKPVYAIHLANVREMIQCPHCGGSGGKK